MQRVIFHDRGVGRESRLYLDGRIMARQPEESEMLYPELFASVEARIANGETAGLTNDPSYPEWLLSEMPSGIGQG